jgi:tRNA (adenine37-N6)-methyltransferase
MLLLVFCRTAEAGVLNCRFGEAAMFVESNHFRRARARLRSGVGIRAIRRAVVALTAVLFGWSALAHAEPPPVYKVSPVGWIRKAGGRTFIEIDRRYQPALLGVERLKSLQVLWWFDRNDTPEKRAILQVHPRGDADNPLRGVFATRSPLRPNLIALTEVAVIAVRDNVIEIDDIDAFPDTPVLDLKP